MDTPARSYFWSRFVVAALVVCTATLTVSGIASTYFDLGGDWNPRLEMLCAASFAGIAAFALMTSQIAAGMAQRLSKSENVAAFRIALACTVVCGGISVGGVHMGALVLGLDWRVLDLGGLLLAGVKPCMSFVTEASIELERAEMKALKRAEDDRADRLVLDERDRRDLKEIRALDAANANTPREPVRASAPPRPRSTSRPSFVRQAANAAAVSAIVLGGGAQAAHAAPLEPVATTLKVGAVTDADRAKAKALIAAGTPPGEASRQTGVPAGTCRRWACELRVSAEAS